MKSTIEIKYRGPLSNSGIAALKKYLQGHAHKIKQENESVYFFESTVFPSIGDFSWGTARLSFKISGPFIFLRFKEGNAAASKRKNYTSKIKRSESKNLFYIFFRLGLTHAFYRPALRTEYKLGSLLIIIKQQCVMGDHFEIQIENESVTVKKELMLFLKKFQLRCWTETEYKNRITKLMKTSPAISLLDVEL